MRRRFTPKLCSQHSSTSPPITILISTLLSSSNTSNDSKSKAYSMIKWIQNEVHIENQ